MSEKPKPAAAEATFDAAVAQAKGEVPAGATAQDGAQPSGTAPPSHDPPVGKGSSSRVRGRSGRRKARQVRDAKGRIVGNLPSSSTAPSSATVQGPPAPAGDDGELAEPSPAVVAQWARVIKRTDGLIASSLGTAPLEPVEAAEGGRAVAILLDYYAPRLGERAGPAGPLYLWLATAYGPRLLEVAERRFREAMDRRRRKHLTAGDHAAERAAELAERDRVYAAEPRVSTVPVAPAGGDGAAFFNADGSVRTEAP